MNGFLLRFLITALGLWLAASLVSGVTITGTWTLIFAAFWLGIVNAVVRPMLVFLTLPLTLITLGLFLLVINAAMFGLVAALLDDFHVASFWSSLLGAIIVSITAWIGSSFIGANGRYEVLVITRR